LKKYLGSGSITCVCDNSLINSFLVDFFEETGFDRGVVDKFINSATDDELEDLLRMMPKFYADGSNYLDILNVIMRNDKIDRVMFYDIIRYSDRQCNVRYEVPDEFTKIDDILRWSYYNNGENPDTEFYSTVLTNVRVWLNDAFGNPLSLLFQGDMSKDRISFIHKLTVDSDIVFTIYNERKVPRYLFMCGHIFHNTLDDPFNVHWIFDTNDYIYKNSGGLY